MLKAPPARSTAPSRARAASRRTHARRAARISICALAPMLVACGSLGHRHKETRVTTVAHIAGSALSIHSVNGSVRAAATQTDTVSIEATLYGEDPLRIADATLHADRTEDNTLKVWIEWPEPGIQDNEGASIHITLPDANGLTVRTSNGSVRAVGLAGHADLRTTNGSVTVTDHDGPVNATTSNGSLNAARVHGPIHMTSSNGSADIEHATGTVEIETSNGSVELALSPDNPGPISVRTSNASVRLALGNAFVGRLRLDTSNASIRLSEIEHARVLNRSERHAELAFGADQPISTVQTSNGSVRVYGTEPLP